jgi:DNA-binding CsgD family transcriptional regulator
MVGEVMGLLDLDELLPAILEALLRAVPSKWASLNEVGPDRVQALVVPHLDPVWIERFAALAHENPIYQRWVRTQDARPYRFRDVCAREELEATRLYREIYAVLGIEYQLAFALPHAPNHMLAIVLHRETHDFTDAERDLVDRARPFLIEAYRNALEHSAARGAEPGMLEDALITHGLTVREAEVMRLVALGGSNRHVAEQLGLSERTVQKHLERCFRKLGVSRRSDASKRAWALLRRE